MASKAWTARSTPITKTRSPATSGGVTTADVTRLRQISRPASKVTTSLPRVTTLVKRPSLPTPAEMALPALARQITAPDSACKARMLAITGHCNEETTPLHRTVATIGKFTLPMLVFHTCLPVILGA